MPYVNANLDMSKSYGIGFAFRFSDNFTASFDIHRTEWDDFIYKDANGYQSYPVTGKRINVSEIMPTYQIRLGAEYLFINPSCIIPLRGGIFYDPVPAEGSPDDFFGCSLGSGIAVKCFILDISYQYKFGHNVRKFILQGYDFSQDEDEHMIYSSMILHF